MTKDKFSKAEWKLFGYQVKCKVEFGNGWYPICNIEIFNEGKANAHLIAAAPEMYEMLSKLSSLLTDINAHVQVNEIEKLLAKARGEINGKES